MQVSKKLSWLLRHGAAEEGLQLDANGYLNVQDVLSNRKIRGLKVSMDELGQLVADNDKQRFTMRPVVAAKDSETGENADVEAITADSKPSDWLIRANQGHSIKVEDDGLLTPITTENMPLSAVHGTTHAAWPLIVASGGLKAMTRNHVHFASGLPAGFTSIAAKDQDGDATTTTTAPVISGMRKSSTVLVFLDLPKAIAAGLKFWFSDNGVILSEGNAEGLVPLRVFKRVEDRTGEGVLLEDGSIVKEAPEKWAAKRKDKMG